MAPLARSAHSGQWRQRGRQFYRAPRRCAAFDRSPMLDRDLPLGDELLALVLAKLSPADLGAAEGVCRRWRTLAAQHSLWRRHAAEAGAREQRQDGASDKQRFWEAQWDGLLSRPTEFVRTVRPERHAHAAAVTSLSALPGAALLASASADNSVRLWALPVRRTLRPRPLCVAQHPAAVLWVHLLSPELCASATAAAVFVWRIEPVAAGAAGAAGSVQASSSGGSSGAASGGTVPPLGRKLRLLRRIAVDSGWGGRPLLRCACAWDQFCAAGCADGTVRILDLFSGTCSKLLRLHDSRDVAALQAVRGPGGADLLVSAGGDGRLCITDVASGLTLAEAAAPRGVACLALDPESGVLLAGGAEAACRTLHRWSAGRRLCGLPSPAQRLPMLQNMQLPALPALRGLPGTPFTALALPAVGLGQQFLAGDTQGLVSVCSTQTAQEALSFGVPAQAGGSAAAAAASGPKHEPADPPRQGPARAAAASVQRQRHPQPTLFEQQQAWRQLGPGTSRPAGVWQAHSSRPCQAAEQGAAEGGHCTSLCVHVLPMCAGFADGTLLFWRWRRRDAAAPAAAPAVVAAPARLG